MDAIQKQLLQEVADLHDIPEGAYNLRANGESVGRKSTANIEIISKTDVSGFDIRIKPNTKKESVHIPVVLSESGLKETVYNDFYIGENSDVLIVAGCGIDNCGTQDSEHDGVHRFYIGKNARIRYAEKRRSFWSAMSLFSRRRSFLSSTQSGRLPMLNLNNKAAFIKREILVRIDAKTKAVFM